MSHQKLPIHELGAVIVLSALILSLTLISNFRGSSSLEQVASHSTPSVSSPEVEVSIQGAVEHPEAISCRGERWFKIFWS